MTYHQRFQLIRKRKTELAFVLITLLFCATLIGFAVIISDVRNNTNSRIALVHENQKRIKDIQESRVSSCKTTYLGIREVFKPFFPPPPRSEEQQANLDKFNSTIDRLIKECERQVKPKVNG